MVATRSQQAVQEELNHVLDVLGFNDGALNVLQENNITSITYLRNTRRVTFNVADTGNRVAFSITDAEPLQSFKK